MKLQSIICKNYVYVIEYRQRSFGTTSLPITHSVEFPFISLTMDEVYYLVRGVLFHYLLMII
jgi:hypothetical protein